MNVTITIAIIVITTLISIGGFYNDKIKSDLIFYPPAITERNQWYRFITCGLIHANTPHLLFNMYALYMFGDAVEKQFNLLFNEWGKLLYIIMYVTALVACLLPTYFKHRHNAYFLVPAPSLKEDGAVHVKKRLFLRHVNQEKSNRTRSNLFLYIHLPTLASFI